MDEDLIRVEVKFSKQFYPKFNAQIGDGDFAIISWVVLNVEEGEPKVSPHFNSITVKGNYPEFSLLETYTIIGRESPNDYGMQYELIYMGQPVKLNDAKSQKIFLKRIVSENIMEEMFKTLDNPIDTIENKNIDQLCSVKGIGKATAESILKKYDEHKDLSKVYVALDNYGITNTMLQKLLDTYGSPDTVIKKVRDNPYQLASEVSGIGFKKADQIALENGLEWDNPDRVEGFLIYMLEEKAESGDSYIYADELMYAIESQLGDINPEVIGNTVMNMVQKNTIGLIERKPGEHKRVYLTKYYNLELNVANELKRILNGKNNFAVSGWREDIKQIEDDQGWKHTDEQLEGIEKVINSQVCVISGLAGCVDGDTEFFNGRAWKKINQYEREDKVLQFNNNYTTTLVTPTKYHKYPCTTLNHIQSQSGHVNQIVSDEHNMVYLNDDGNLAKIKASDMIKQYQETSVFNGRFLSSFDYSGEGMKLSDDEISLMSVIMVGGVISDTEQTCTIHVRGEIRAKRLINVLTKTGAQYTIGVVQEHELYSFVLYNSPRFENVFTPVWYNSSPKQLQLALKELLYWSGEDVNTKNNTLSTSIKENADFMQFAGASCGYASHIMTHVESKSSTKEEYTVVLSKFDEPGVPLHTKGNNNKTTITPYNTKDGYKYCFTVDSGMLVLRNQGTVFITGNSGKTSVVTAMLKALEGYSFAQTALSGRASAKLQEVTGAKGQTIHRLLGFNPALGFEFNSSNKLPYDIVILDEISLVGGDIFLSLIRAIPDGSKLIILGDDGQLESIGCMNLARDLITSGTIPSVELTKIHRQAAKSGIITEASKIRSHEQLVDRSFTGVSKRGELQDFELHVVENSEDTRPTMVKYFKVWLPKVDNVMDIQLLVPVNERGDASVVKLNQDIQAFYNPPSRHKAELEIVINKAKNKKFIIRETDKIMVMKNNYQTKNDFGVNTPIFNGWIGIVKSIYQNKAIVYFPVIKDEVVIEGGVLRDVTLGYACSVHKYQGSQSEVIIGGIDYSTPPFMRTKELVYTLVTRAEKHCILVTQNPALREAINTSGVAEKNTFLKEILDEK